MMSPDQHRQKMKAKHEAHHHMKHGADYHAMKTKNPEMHDLMPRIEGLEDPAQLSKSRMV